jgi:outer membrane usher protein
MSPQVPATRLRLLALVAGTVIALLPDPTAPARAEPGDAALQTAAAQLPGNTGPARSLEGPFATLIARVIVNSVSKGDIPILRDEGGNVFVPAAEFETWGLSLSGATPVSFNGERYIPVSQLQGVEAHFDAKTVTLNLQVTAKAFAGSNVNLEPPRRSGVIYPSNDSFFLNYGINATGDDSFGHRTYQFASELGARSGNWLFYNTTSNQWDNTTTPGFVRLQTNLQYDDRPNLRRLTLGDFFTPTLDLLNSVPLGGLSLTKFYSMDPYFIQYPTAAFRTEVEFPSTVEVRVAGNLVAQRTVAPGPVDITNISGVSGAQDVSVTIRDPFGRVQVLQQPFFFATNAGLAEGLHEYSYNVGFLRRQYGFESDNYGDLAVDAFHRYAFTDQLTLGLRGQGSQSLYNVGPFGTYQLPQWGIFGGGVSVGGRDGRTGTASTAAYSYTGHNISLTLGAQYLSPNFAQLTDLEPGSGPRTRLNEYASASVFSAKLGTIGATYTALTSYGGPNTKLWNLSYTLGVLGQKGLVSLNYARTLEPQTTSTWMLSFRYFFDTVTSAVAAVGGASGHNTQQIALERAIPQGEGIGYTLSAGHEGGGSDGAFGQAFVQVNAANATFGGQYARANSALFGSSLSNAFFAGSIGAVGGTLFAARPVADSFALIRVPELPDVPIYANSWYAGKTNAAGEVVATNINAYYDNFINFKSKDLPLDYVFPSAEKVISPMTRSGTLIEFAIRKNRAVLGVLVTLRDGKPQPLEFKEISLVRGDTAIQSFTARRGEFYVEGVEPGEYRLRVEGDPSCTARLSVPESAEAMTDVGTVVCAAAAR